MSCRLVSAIEDALSADMLTPTGKISELVGSYLYIFSCLKHLDDEGADLLLFARRYLRRYENARKLTTFQMGVSPRTEEAKADLIKVVRRLSKPPLSLIRASGATSPQLEC